MNLGAEIINKQILNLRLQLILKVPVRGESFLHFSHNVVNVNVKDTELKTLVSHRRNVQVSRLKMLVTLVCRTDRGP